MISGMRFVCTVLLMVFAATPSNASRIMKARNNNVKQTFPLFDLTKITETIVKLVEAYKESSSFFTQTPPDINGGLDSLDKNLWTLVEQIVPQKEYNSTKFQKGKQAWDHFFGAAKEAVELKKEIMAFATEGDTEALTRGMDIILSQLTELSESYFPDSTKYFKALRNLIDGLGEGWIMFGEGDIEGALEEIWKAVKQVTDELLPDTLLDHKNYGLIMGTIDNVMGQLNQHILEYQKAMKASKLCYKRTRHRPRVRPHQCRDGFQWDQGHLCLPTRSNGADCYSKCGRRGGMCTSFCGDGKACCRLNYGRNAPECHGATGYVNYEFTHGSPEQYYQCVTPGPALVFKIEDCGEPHANGLWVQSGQHRNRPKYHKVHDKNTIIEYSQKRGAWRLYIDKTWLGYGRDTLYQADEDTQTIPTTGWKTIVGLGKPPNFLFLQQSEAATALAEVMSNSTDEVTQGWWWDSTPKGSHEAICDIDSPYNEKSGHWCLKPCPEGYTNSGSKSCQQICGGTHPATGMGMCGVTEGEIQKAIAKLTIEVALGAVDLHDTYRKAKEHGVDTESITQTANTLVNLGKNFAHPRCPESMTA